MGVRGRPSGGVAERPSNSARRRSMDPRAARGHARGHCTRKTSCYYGRVGDASPGSTRRGIADEGVLTAYCTLQPYGMSARVQ